MGGVLHSQPADYWKTVEINYSFLQSIFGKLGRQNSKIPEISPIQRENTCFVQKVLILIPKVEDSSTSITIKNTL